MTNNNIIINEIKIFLEHHTGEQITEHELEQWEIEKTDKKTYLITTGNQFQIQTRYNLIFIYTDKWYCVNYNVPAIIIDGKPYVLI